MTQMASDDLDSEESGGKGGDVLIKYSKSLYHDTQEVYYLLCTWSQVWVFK